MNQVGKTFPTGWSIENEGKVSKIENEAHKVSELAKSCLAANIHVFNIRLIQFNSISDLVPVAKQSTRSKAKAHCRYTDTDTDPNVSNCLIPIFQISA